jgi:glucokinase
MMAATFSQPVLAIDIGGTKLAAGVISPAGLVHFPKTVPTPAKAGGEAVMQRVIELALDVRRASEAEPGLRPAAVGLSTGGLVVLSEGSISYATSAIPGWGGMPVRARLVAALGLPVAVENDGNAMALGEALFGAGRGRSLVVGITVGTGIGGGIILDGRIFHGAHGISNNIGHTLLKMDGRLCPCGRRGCLEAYASAPAMAAYFTRRVDRGRLLEKYGLQPGGIGVKEIAQLAAQGAPEAVAALHQGAEYLGAGIASLIHLLDPDIVVIGGGASQSGPVYFDRLRAAVTARSMPGAEPVPVVPAELKAWANLVGAACIVWGKEKIGIHPR